MSGCLSTKSGALEVGMNLRLVPRLRRRLRVTIGAVQAFTSDISSTGFSVELMQALRP